MKFSIAVTLGLLLSDKVSAFAPPAKRRKGNTYDSRRSMAMDMPDMPAVSPQADVPVIQKNQYGPSDVRYSDFLRLVDADKIEKVTFSSDGSQLLGVDVDGTRLKIEALPNDPSLLSELTQHKVRI
jgi:cell division protease FtsH